MTMRSKLISDLNINFLPRYSSPWIALIFLFFSFGYAKIPFIGMPFGAIVFLVDWRNIVRLSKTNIGKLHIFFCIVFVAFSLARQLFESDLIFFKNFSFSAILVYKSFVGLYTGYLFIYLIYRKSGLITAYIFFQILLMTLSIFNEDLYSALLLFQTTEASDVFSDIFGQRSLGFGLIHNEGVVLLALMYVLHFDFSSSSKLLRNVLGVTIYLGAFSSRLLLVLLPAWHILKSKIIIVIVILLIAVCIMFLDIQSGPLTQVFELYIYYQNNSSLGTKTTDAIGSMKYVPDSIGTWIIGDGRYFGDQGFYQETDIGFSRIIFFGGLCGLFFYILLCCWPVFFITKKFWRKGYVLVIYLLYVYFIANIKGVSIQSFSFISVLFYLQLHKVSLSIPSLKTFSSSEKRVHTSHIGDTSVRAHG